MCGTWPRFAWARYPPRCSRDQRPTWLHRDRAHVRGGNAREVVQAVVSNLNDIHQHKLLPGGLRIVPFTIASN